MSCGDPNATHRTIHIDPAIPGPGVESQFYPCLPGGDPAKGHVMTTVNTEGYNIAWFSPRQSFANVRKVCWDQNLTFIGNGKWTQVVFLTAGEVAGNSSDLGFTSPEFADAPNLPSTPRGSTAHGVKIGVFAHDNGGSTSVDMTSWSQNGSPDQWGAIHKDFASGGPATSDKAPRYQFCLTDNENGTLTLVNKATDGTTRTSSVQGSIPNEPVRVVFEDDNYNPDKHHSNAGEVARNSGEGYTWHWDNIQIT
jgi:hypothetical protein